MQEVVNFLLRDSTRDGNEITPKNRITLTQNVKPFGDWREFMRTVNCNRVKIPSPLDMVDRSWFSHGGQEKEISVVFLGDNAYGTGYVEAMAKIGYRPCTNSVPYFMGLVYQLTKDVNGPLCSIGNTSIVAAEPDGQESVFKGNHIKEGHIYLNTCYSHMPLALVETRRTGGVWHAGTWGFLGEKIPGFEKIDHMGLSDNIHPLI